MQATRPHYFVYILGNPSDSDVQVGIAGDLQQQLQNLSQGAAKQEEKRLVYYEHYEVEEVAKNREREILKGGPNSAQQLVASMNPNWLDLSDTLA